MTEAAVITVNLDLESIVNMAKQAGADNGAIYQILDTLAGKLSDSEKVKQITFALSGAGYI